MELKGRLKLIADKVPACETICDIGTDHAYIPIFLILKGICKKAIAADVKTGPLLAAEENIKLYKLGEYIETRLGNGLEPISRGEAEAIVIAGMGGALIREILQKGFDVAKEAELLILQPMNAVEAVREWLYESGFEIYDEELVSEEEKIYNVITARWTGSVKKPQLIHYYIGESLIRKKDPLLKKYIGKKIILSEKIIAEIGNNIDGNEEVIRKHKWMKEELEYILNNLISY
ncbi:MAG: class I SAM-dependent methyltransferase [Clostridia bacterium]|nr:class I SAM-dependent methyltransferase [Clostridia bacterium]